MEFGVSKCGVPVLSKGKVAKLSSRLLPHGKMTRENDKREYKYLGSVGMDKIKETDMKEKCASGYEKRFKIFFEIKIEW